MSVAAGAVKMLQATASATVQGVEAAGGAVVGAMTGAARGTVEGAVSGARNGIDVPTATVLGVVAAGVTGLVDWPLAAAAGGVAGAAYLLRRARTEPETQGPAEKPKPRKSPPRKSSSSKSSPSKSARQKQSSAGSRRARTAAR
ncbi:hypothetical protein [Nocardia jiangxiensis]|uniref:Transmembrane protein n=1 Tax=Nocardia jiangxiensis TaxID=282685 RepID=A0ABW6SG58_9NOCA|nr:hypothetical protein [Nocardia jiangxiensis]